MSTEPQGGAVQSEAAQGDEATASAVAATEAGAGAVAQGDAQAEAERARDEYVARVAAETAQRVVAEMIRSQQAPASPAAQPPTAGRGVVAELQAEAAAIQQEDARLRAAITRDGLTAQNLYDQAELVRREARFTAQVNLVGLQESERRQEISARTGKDDDEARATAWRSFAAQHPNVDAALLRDAFDKRWEREAAAKATPAKPSAAPSPGRSAVNVSGPSEVTAQQAKARTMSREQANAHRATLRSEGRDAEAAKFDRELRSGGVILKG